MSQPKIQELTTYVILGLSALSALLMLWLIYKGISTGFYHIEGVLHGTH